MWIGHQSDGQVIAEWPSGKQNEGEKNTFPYNDLEAEKKLDFFLVNDYGVPVEVYPKRGELFVDGHRLSLCYDGVRAKSYHLVWFRRKSSTNKGEHVITVVGLELLMEEANPVRHELILFIYPDGHYDISPGRCGFD